jgi:flagellar biosynthesis activator protein FlaF
MRAATRLKRVQDSWETDRGDFDGALAYNRKLWTILSTSATEFDSPLPPDVKRNIALIAIFIFNRSLDLIIDPNPSGLDSLIDINKAIAQGLSTVPAEAA